MKWHTEVRKVSELKNWKDNPRTISVEAYEELRESIGDLGNFEPLVIDTDGTVLAGNQRLKIHIENGDEEVEVSVPERKLTEEEIKKIGVISNRHSGEWDMDKLANDFEDILEELGAEDLLHYEQPLEMRETKLKPIKKYHILISVPIEEAELLQEELKHLENKKKYTDIYINELIMKKTDNSYFLQKVAIRKEDVVDGMKILDCFSGYGTIWETIKRDYDIDITSIEKRDTNRIIYTGNNIKLMEQLDLTKYDIIDLDAYGMPTEQLKIISKTAREGQIIHFTFITVGFGGISESIKLAYGYSKEQIRQCPTLFNKEPFEQFKNFLYTLFGEKVIVYLTNNINKYYGKIYI